MSMRRQLGRPPLLLWLAKRRICRDVNGEDIGLVAGLFQDAAKKRQGPRLPASPRRGRKINLERLRKNGPLGPR